nr:unnamed protein product [Naegleria fowleri]
MSASDSFIYDTSCSTLQQPLKKSLKKQKSDTPFVKFHLVITELSENVIHRLQRTLAHKFGKVNQQYGFFHTALVFGPFYLEWGDSSLVTIRSISSSKAVLSHHIHTFQGATEIQQAMTNLAQLIAHWNGEMHYSTEKCNCQHFVLDVFKTFGISHMTNYGNNRGNSSLKHYLERLKNEGCCKMELSLSEPLRKLFNSSNSLLNHHNNNNNHQSITTMTFKTHQELDQFYWTIHEKLPSYFQSEEGQSDVGLIRAFDRAFWLRMASSEKRRDESCLPLRRKRNNSMMSHPSSSSSSRGSTTSSSNSSILFLPSHHHHSHGKDEFEILCPFYVMNSSSKASMTGAVVENELMMFNENNDHDRFSSSSMTSSLWLFNVTDGEDFNFGSYVVKRPVDREFVALGAMNHHDREQEDFVDIIM